MRAVRGQGGAPVLVDVDDAPGEGELLSMRSVGGLDEPKLATLAHRHFALLRPAHIDTLELGPG